MFDDGIHPKSTLKNKWFKIICNVLNSEDYFVQESDSENESWDFKRK